jgi:hypothetical protein
MTYLYLTTDSVEAEVLIEDTNFSQEPKYKYNDIEIEMGESLIKKIGFNPMCSVELDENISSKLLAGIVAKLAKNGLFVAVEHNGDIKRHVPNDMECRNGLVQSALQKGIPRMDEDTCTVILRYSNNPNQIRTFYNKFY